MQISLLDAAARSAWVATGRQEPATSPYWGHLSFGQLTMTLPRPVIGMLGALAATASSAALLGLVVACQPQPTTQPPTTGETGVRMKVELKPGVSLNYEPQNAEELAAIRTELIVLIKNKSITADEARSFIRQQKTRLGLPNPGQTKGFDAMLQQEGLN